jgi:hypothetical protein
MADEVIGIASFFGFLHRILMLFVLLQELIATFVS